MRRKPAPEGSRAHVAARKPMLVQRVRRQGRRWDAAAAECRSAEAAACPGPQATWLDTERERDQVQTQANVGPVGETDTVGVDRRCMASAVGRIQRRQEEEEGHKLAR